MEIIIRQEQDKDYPTSENIIEEAFQEMPFSDNKEHILVRKLRQSNSFIPELSLVAEFDNKPIGHILFTKVMLNSDQEELAGLALAPFSVKPDYQNIGIGSRLIMTGHNIAEQLGFNFIVVIGHPEYYPKFGYQPIVTTPISLPFDIDSQYCFILNLRASGLDLPAGKIEYDPAFFE